MKHRISHIDQPGVTPTQLWTGEDTPTEVDISAVAAYVRGRQRTLGHTDMLQGLTDTVRIETRSRFGWKVVDVVNIYDIDNSLDD